MSEPSKDTSILTVLAERLVKQRLPRLELLKVQLDRGETLTDNDIMFLKQALTDAQEKSDVDRAASRDSGNSGKNSASIQRDYGKGD